MTIQEEINKYNAGELRLYELSPDARAKVIHSDRTSKYGFEPDFVFRAAGVTMDKLRQPVLAEVKDLHSRHGLVPMKLEHDPNNPYDPYAVKILVATTRDSAGQYSNFKEIGFVPRGYCPNCGSSLTGKRAEAYECSDCGHKIRDEAGNITDPTVELNKLIVQASSEGRVQYSMDSITEMKGKPTLGFAVAIKIS